MLSNLDSMDKAYCGKSGGGIKCDAIDRDKEAPELSDKKWSILEGTEIQNTK